MKFLCGGRVRGGMVDLNREVKICENSKKKIGGGGVRYVGVGGGQG